MHTDKTEQMLNLEDSVILISGLIPWCIAGSVPLATVEAPLTSMALGIYLYMVPLVRLIRKKEK
jgi:NhaC family Na+:H+ antiporter